jgi:hypothetical protein
MSFGAAADSPEPRIEAEPTEASSKLFESWIMPAMESAPSIKANNPSLRDYIESEFKDFAYNQNNAKMTLEDALTNRARHSLGTYATIFFLEYVRGLHRKRNSTQDPILQEEVDLLVMETSQGIRFELQEILDKAVERGCE